MDRHAVLRRSARLAWVAGAVTACVLPSLAPRHALAEAIDAGVERVPGERLMPLEVRVNQQPGGGWLLMERAGVLFAPAVAFDEWRLNRPELPPLRVRGQSWYPLSALPGFAARFHPAAQSVDLEFAPQAFTATRLTQPAPKRPTVSKAEPALALNYDLSLTRSAARGAMAQQDLGALLEAAVSGDAGVLSSSYAGRNLAVRGFDAAPRWQRLETSFTRDFPEPRISLRLGDLATHAGAIGRPVFFGGVQLSRNFALEPGFVSRPIPSLAGTSSAPSTLELYINDVLRQTGNLPAGPFTINELPLPDSTGQVRMVVRDILGRETVVEQSFLSSNALLAAGLSDWSVEAGELRRNLGLPDARYATRFGAGLYRLGLSPDWTGELRAGISRPQQEASIAFSHAHTPWPVLVQAGLSGSRSALANGHAYGAGWLLSLERAGVASGWLLRTEGNTAAWRGLGQDLQTPPTRRQTTLSHRLSAGAWGSLGLSAAQTVAGDGSRYLAATAGQSVRVGYRSTLSLGVTRLTGSTAGTRLTATLFVPLGPRSVLSATAAHTRHGDSDTTVGLSASPDEPDGWAWRLLAGERSSAGQAEAGLYRDGPRGSLALDLGQTRELQTLRLGAQGAWVAVDGALFATRRSGPAMALVEVPGQAGVGVSLLGQVAARTGSDGRALLPQLLPYQANAVRLDPSDLPIGAELDSVEMSAVPAARSVVKLRFPVRSGRAALIRVRLADGEPAPPGAEVGIVGDPQVFYMARRGEVFVTGLAPVATLVLRWRGQSCSLALRLPPDDGNDITRLGPLTCAGVSP
jgi:outer membrane usher protein